MASIQRDPIERNFDYAHFAGLYPEHVQLQMDQVDEAVVDMKYVLRPAWYGAALGRNPKVREGVQGALGIAHTCTRVRCVIPLLF